MKSISIPFQIDGYGKVASNDLPERVWANRVRSVMGTPVGQRVMNPSFGSNLPRNLMSAPVPGFIDTAVRSAASQWLPDINISSVQVSDNTTTDTELNVEIVYEIPQSQVDQRTYSVRIF